MTRIFFTISENDRQQKIVVRPLSHMLLTFLHYISRWWLGSLQKDELMLVSVLFRLQQQRQQNLTTRLGLLWILKKWWFKEQIFLHAAENDWKHWHLQHSLLNNQRKEYPYSKFIQLCCNEEQYTRSFLLQAISLFNCPCTRTTYSLGITSTHLIFNVFFFFTFSHFCQQYTATILFPLWDYEHFFNNWLKRADYKHLFMYKKLFDAPNLEIW